VGLKKGISIFHFILDVQQLIVEKLKRLFREDRAIEDLHKICQGLEWET
jgi:hypothetical protein